MATPLGTRRLRRAAWRGTACQCPAIRGRRRCRLHGGLSTGPRTVQGLARIREANTRHGRYSAEQKVLARLRREFRANDIESARAMPDRAMRAHFLQVAMADELSASILDQSATWPASKLPSRTI